MRTFERAGLTFDVIDSGPDDGPVVVLLHGFPQFADSWSAVSPVLNEHGYRCLAPDQRGYSPGAVPTGRGAYRASELADDVVGLIDAVAAGRRIHLVGHDWGAAVAWAVAISHPDRLASLTAVSVPHPAAMLGGLRHLGQARASWYMLAFQLPWLPEFVLTGRGDDGAGLAGFLTRAGQSREAAQRDAGRLAEQHSMTAALNWYRAMALSARSPKPAVTVPTLFVWSDGDVAIREATARACADYVNADYRFEVLEGISHWIPDEAPERLTPLLLEHFEAHLARP